MIQVKISVAFNSPYWFKLATYEQKIVFLLIPPKQLDSVAIFKN